MQYAWYKPVVNSNGIVSYVLHCGYRHLQDDEDKKAPKANLVCPRLLLPEVDANTATSDDAKVTAEGGSQVRYPKRKSSSSVSYKEDQSDDDEYICKFLARSHSACVTESTQMRTNYSKMLLSRIFLMGQVQLPPITNHEIVQFLELEILFCLPWSLVLWEWK